MDDTVVEKESPEAELNRLRAAHSIKVIVSQMPQTFEKDAVDVVLLAVSKNKHLKDIAQHIKQEYDRRHPGSGKATEGVYHCIVGKSFASAVSHETRHFIQLKVDNYNVILWKSKDSPFHVNEV